MQTTHSPFCKETVMGICVAKNLQGEIMKGCVEQGKSLSIRCLQMTKSHEEPNLRKKYHITMIPLPDMDINGSVLFCTCNHQMVF